MENERPHQNLQRFLPAVAVALAAIALVVWFNLGSGKRLEPRVPGVDRPEGYVAGSESVGNPVPGGRVVKGTGKPADLSGSWPRFRGTNFNALSTDGVALSREWPASGPPILWSLDVGEGYAGAAIWQGSVFVMDYDKPNKEDALRCLSLADGSEIWRYAYPVNIKRDHGITRTVPAVTPEAVVAIGPKCHVLCVETETGELRWSLDLVGDFGATVPPWYTGQCPLIDGDAVILAPGGPEALLMAVDLQTGEELWRTPNPNLWKMTHSSVVPIEFAGKRMYVYCASRGVVGVDASDGSILWGTEDWKISIATVPSPVDLGNGRIFLTGGYNAGSLMMQLKETEDGIVPETVFRLKPDVFGATQHSPIFYRDHLFGVRADGRFICLALDGTVVWESDSGSKFGLGAFMIADGLIFAIDDGGTLSLIEATPEAWRPLDQATVLEGPDAWGPMALADGRLIVRDLNRMICLDVAAR